MNISNKIYVLTLLFPIKVSTKNSLDKIFDNTFFVKISTRQKVDYIFFA